LEELLPGQTLIGVVSVLENGSCFQTKTCAALSKEKKTRNVKRIQKQITKFAMKPVI